MEAGAQMAGLDRAMALEETHLGANHPPTAQGIAVIARPAAPARVTLTADELPPAPMAGR